MRNYIGKVIKGRERTRYMVRRRDNFTCQDCKGVRTPEFVGKHNQKLKDLKGRIRLFDVHHLNGLCGKKSKAYDSVSDMDGLITLCHKCHYNRPEHRVHKMIFKNKNRVVPLKEYGTIQKMREDRFTLREISEKYGVSRERIRQILLLLKL